MTTLSEHIIVAGAKNRLPMLEKSMYDSWASRIRLFIKGKKHGRMMLDSIDNGLLQGEDPIECINKAMAFLSDVASRFPDSNNQLRTSSNTRNQATIQDAFQTKDLDAYDSDCNDLSSAKAVLMDEVPEFIIKFLKMIQVRLNATVRNIKTDNGTEFINQTLKAYYEEVGFSHQTSVARTLQHNGIVKRQNRTVVEAARTMNVLYDWVSRASMLVKFLIKLSVRERPKSRAAGVRHWTSRQEDQQTFQEHLYIVPYVLCISLMIDKGTVRETLAEGTEGAPHLGPERPRVYFDLSPKEKDMYNVDIRMLLEGSELTKEDRESQLVEVQLGYGGAQNRVGNANPGQARQIKCYNCNDIRHKSQNFTQLKRPQNSDYFKDKMLLMQAQENRVALDEEQLLFLTDDCDAFDSDVDEALTAQTMFMANISSADPVSNEVSPSYDLDILSKHVKDNAVPGVQIVDNSLTAELATYKEQVKVYERRARFELTEREQKINEQLRIVITGRNFKEETLKKEHHSVKLQLASTINHNKLMVEEVTSLKKDFKQKENKYLEDFLDMKSLKEKVEERLFKQDQSLQIVHMLCRPNPCYNELNKVAIGYTNPLCLTHAKQVHPALYNGHEIIKDDHVPAIVHNTEDTLEIAEITKRKMNDKMKDPECVNHKVKIAPHDYSKENFLATFKLQKQLTPEQIFWSQDLIKMKTEALKDISKDHVKPIVLAPHKYAIDVEPIPSRLRNNKEAHLDYLRHLKESVETTREIAEEAKVVSPLDSSIFFACHYTKHSQELLEYAIGTCPQDSHQQDKKHAFAPLIRKKQVTFSKQCDTSNSSTHKHVTQLNTQTTIVHVSPSTGVNRCTDASGSQPRSNAKKNRISPTKGVNRMKVEEHHRTNKSHLRTTNHDDSSSRSKRTVIGDSVISRVYYVEGLGYNLFYVRQFYDFDLGVAFRKHSCYVRDTDGVELIKVSRGSNLYTISVEDMMKSSSICLLSKASNNKSWLWHQRLNHLNFSTINDLARKDLVRGLPRLKFKKDHLCSACQLGKSKKHTHKPKTENTNLEVLNTLHMDLCGPMRVQTINRKKYILNKMTTLSEHIIVAGAKNRLPMLEKSMYDSWASRIRLFIKGKKHGRMMLDSIDNGLLVYPTVE
nr:integrase, catalytic region, zinc finger, CCHC-type, peptidase aspartic, catalytic [Tanacetum cinerariifolium]